MTYWWKAPILQGEENDYGDYDYLIEDIPKDDATRDWFKYGRCQCDDCGKWKYGVKTYNHYFSTMDGYDYTSYSQCISCELKARFNNLISEMERSRDIVNLAWEMTEHLRGWKRLKKFRKLLIKFKNHNY